MKRIISILAIALAAFVLASCGGGGGGGAVAVGSNTVGGAAAKGPFQKGSTVTAFKLNADGTRIGTAATKASVKVTDNLGTYSIKGLSWSGLTEVEITGFYLDENTGAVSAKMATMSTIINLPVVGAVVSNTTANPNVASTVAASVARKTLLSKPANVDAVLQSASLTTAAALGLPTKDAKGAPIDLSKLDVTKTADPRFGTASSQLLALSASLLDATSGGASGGSVTALAGSLAKDVLAGKALGTTSGSTAIIKASQATVIATAATIAANISAAVDTVKPGTSDPALATKLPVAAKIVKKKSTTTLRGLACVGNTFTVGPVVYTISPSGAAAAGGGTIFANAVTFKLNVADYSNLAGTGPKAASYAATLNFRLASTVAGDQRVISGSLSPVNISTNGLGGVSATVPLSAVLTYSGKTRAGLAVNGTATKIKAITSAANVISINANKLATRLGIGLTAGTYTFAFGIAGLNLGLEKAIPPGISKLLPIGASVGGRAFTGTLTTI